MNSFSKAGGPFVIAELSANHNHSFETAVKTIEAAAKAGASAVKLQTYTADTLTIDCDSELFRIKGTAWDGMNLYKLYQQAYTPWEWHAGLKKVADGCGLAFFSTPFDSSAVDFLEGLGVPMHKVASFELVDIPLLEKIASTGKPAIMSTGMASLEEIELAVETLRSNGCPELALLKCCSAYPAKPEEMNLATIPDLARRFNCAVGLSDHSMELAVPVAAVALGATIIEKHLILDRALGGPDSHFSLTPSEFAEMVKAASAAAAAVGEVKYGGSPDEIKSKAFRRSLFVVADVRKGEPLTPSNVRSIRPSDGLPPKFYKGVMGLRAARDLRRGEPLQRSMIEGFV